MKKMILMSGMIVVFAALFNTANAIEGFYKDVFQDEGTGISGANLDIDCEYIGFTMEHINTNSNKVKQNEVMIQNQNDANGYLLYPDGDPRFALIYYHGGVMAHASDLGEEGRERIRTHYYNGGSQFGSSAGSYMLSSSSSNYFRLWPGRMNGPNVSNTQVDKIINAGSPFIGYNGFIEGDIIENVYHNNGGSIDTTDIPAGTEICAMHNDGSMQGYAAIWTWKDNDTTGRVLGHTGHPEGNAVVDRIRYITASMLLLADGLGIPDIKHHLDNGETIVMDKETADNDPAYTKIGDKQYHHFTIQVPNEANNLIVMLDGEDGFDMHLFCAEDTFAFVHSADYMDTAQGPDKSLVIPSVSPGTWYIGVKCATTVISNQGVNGRDLFPEYSGKLEVLNGVAYSIFAAWDTTHIKVLAPIGGEQWARGHAYDIKWFDDIDENVRIELLKNGTPVDTLAQSIPSNGTFLWDIPGNLTLGSDYRIRITSIADSDTTDVSNGDFSIVDPSLTVVHPNGGELVYSDSLVDITWDWAGPVGSVTILYSVDSGSNWDTVIAVTANDGAYSWKVPNVLSSKCKIKICESDDGNPFDESDAVFTIEHAPAITVAFPNGGEKLLVGTEYTISWSSTGAVGAVKIEYSTNNDTNWHTIISSTGNTGNYPWTIPDVGTTNGRIRVSEASDGNPSDMSNNVFTIEPPPSILVVSPNGGEILFSGTSHNVLWKHDGTVGNLKILFSPDNGANWQTVVAGTPNDAVHPWAVPDVVSINCLIKISEAADDDPSDVSDAVFSIMPQPSITVTSPNGGEILKAGSVYDITWTATGTVGNVKIEYSADNGAKWGVIEGNTANDGVQAWTVPVTASAYCKIRISEASDGNPLDESDAIFTIDFQAQTTDDPDHDNSGDHFVVVPNPACNGQEVLFQITPEKDITEGKLKVYDPLGNVVCELDVPYCPANKQSAVGKWNLRNSSDKPVAIGGYLAVLFINDNHSTINILKKMVGIREK